MRNILTIAQKELRSYFVSPMAYVAIGFFVFIYGYFFVVSLNFMVRVSMQAGMAGGPQAININEYMMRPLLGNMAVVMLFLLPALTGRSYAEEKRSGTIELLLSSPLTGPQIILGKYLGALALFTLMLAVTLIHVGVLFIYGEPELGPILSGYLGLWLMGGAFISVGLLISSMTKNQTVAVMGAFGTALMALDRQLDRRPVERLHNDRGAGLSLDPRPLRRFFEGGHRHEASGVLPELHHVRTLPHRAVRRQRAVAGVADSWRRRFSERSAGRASPSWRPGWWPGSWCRSGRSCGGGHWS